MSEENVEIVRRIYAAWTGGSPVDSGLLDPEIEWVNPHNAIETERQQGYVWTIRDGKAVRFQWFNSPEEALEAVGVEG